MADEKSSTVYHIHDRVFRNAMSDLKVAKSFLQHYLPKEIVEKIDFDTLKPCPESYVDKKLKMLVTDVLFSVNLKDKFHKKPFFIYILLEHLSKPRKLAPWHLVQFTCRILEKEINNDPSGPLPLVIPIIVYNGKNKYSYSTSIYDLFRDSEKELAKKYMFNQFQLIDFTQIPDEVMREHKWSNAVELIMKHAQSRDIMSRLESLLEVFEDLFKKRSENYATAMLNYAAKRTKKEDDQRFQTFITKIVNSSLENKDMNLIQLWEKRGFEQGITQGIEQGIQKGYQKARIEVMTDTVKQLLKKGIDIELISQISGFQNEQILKLKEEIST